MNKLTIFFSGIFFLTACTVKTNEKETITIIDSSLDEVIKIPVIFDTDANNELDDQHALAYLLFSGAVFDVKGITVNATYNGGDIQGHYDEAERIMKLCGVSGKIPLLKGANGSFEEIRDSLASLAYDGSDAVEFIIQEARKQQGQKLVLLPVGKLTNIALALQKAPDIKKMVRIVWLGSNYPEPGEYNQENDIPSLNYILDQDVQFEMVMVRYGKTSGSDAVRVTPAMINEKMPGAGPGDATITGRHGGEFTNFGDYSINLFRHIDLHGDPPSRALFDMVAVAIVKNSDWGEMKEIPAPILEDSRWHERPSNNRKIFVWENFNKGLILDDFFETMQNPAIAIPD